MSGKLAALVVGCMLSGLPGATPADANPSELAKLAILGNGAPEGTVVLFGHGFAKGDLNPADVVAMQRVDNKASLVTQMNPITSWPDGSVKVALLAVESPALDKEAALECVLVKDSKANAGQPLDLAKMLAGRKATLTVTPNNGAPWTFDLLAGADNKDRWHSGTLAVSTRVTTLVPAASLGGVTSVRLVADIIVTKDGILEIDSRLANDAIRKAGGGPATYAYTVAIDGHEVYSQAQATQIQYTAWVRRTGRAAKGPMPERPVIRPDYDLLVRGRFTLPWDRSLASSAFERYITRTIAKETPNAKGPYPAWGLNRYAGAVGGRQEIGYRTYACMAWIKTGAPAAQFLAQRQLEVGMSRPQNLWDEELDRWMSIEDWPVFSFLIGPATPLGVGRHEARGLPAEQKNTANDKQHVTVEHAHNGDFWSVVGLLSGRRMAFDGMAMNAAWLTTDWGDRQGPGGAGQEVNYLGLKPDWTTGVAWAPRVGSEQTRSYAWGLRDVCLAAALLPDKYPHREYFEHNAAAYVNAYGTNLAALAAQQGELEGWVTHCGIKTHTAGFMNSFVIYEALDAVNLGSGGPLAQAILEHFAKFRVNSMSSPDFNWRNAACGGDVMIGDGKTLFTKWSQMQARHEEMHTYDWPPAGPKQRNHDMKADWSNAEMLSGGDWQRNVLAGLALLRDAPIALPLRAKAADAMVLYRSERQHGKEDGFPRITPESFFGDCENLNSLCPYGSTWRWDVAPVVRANQSFTVAPNARAGQIAGIVLTDGGLPRASKPAGDDAFVIVSQPEGKPFSISRGGVLKVAGTTPAGTTTLGIYAATYDSAGKEYRGPTVQVKIEGTETK